MHTVSRRHIVVDENPGPHSARAGTLKDLDTLTDISNTIGIMPGTTICGLADGAAWPIKNALKKFRPEFEEYIKSGRKSAMREAVAAH